MLRPALVAGTVVLTMTLSCCGGRRRSAGITAPNTTSAPVTSASPPPQVSPVDLAALVRGLDTRRQAYLQYAAGGGGYYAQLARLELSQPIQRQALDDLCDFVDARHDTADFKVTALLRLLYLHGTDPALPADLRQRAERTLLGFRYWVDEPGRDSMIFWSENHQVLFASCELLAGQLYPQQVFANSGLTGAEHVRKARRRLLAWLDARLHYGFSEWYSPVYYPHDVAPLLNLVDFAQDPELAQRAAMVLDLLIFDLARLTTRQGSFAGTAGRIYEEHKLSGREQAIGDLIEVLFGTRGEWRERGATAATSFVTSRRYHVPHALLAVGTDKDRPVFEDRARVGVGIQDAAAEQRGFQTLEEGMFWWGQGGYVAPEVIALTRRMLDAWDLWDHPVFKALRPLRGVPGPLLAAASRTLGPATRGDLLGGAETYCYRTPDAQLSSVQDYGRGRVGFQQHAWQASLGLEASVFTTAPGTFGRNGPGLWTGSGSLPQVVQSRDVLVALYDPPRLQRLVFPAMTHASFPRAAFDEVVQRGSWTFARKGDGYLGLYSALPTQWTSSGPYTGRELVAWGYRNVWVCQVGRRAEDGSFQDFRDALLAARLDVRGAGYGPPGDPLDVDFQAPGVGRLQVGYGRPATLDGAAVHPGRFPRFDNPYAQQAWGDPQLEIHCGGATLRHDRVAGTRSGDGL